MKLIILVVLIFAFMGCSRLIESGQGIYTVEKVNLDESSFWRTPIYMIVVGNDNHRMLVRPGLDLARMSKSGDKVFLVWEKYRREQREYIQIVSWITK